MLEARYSLLPTVGLKRLFGGGSGPITVEMPARFPTASAVLATISDHSGAAQSDIQPSGVIRGFGDQAAAAFKVGDARQTYEAVRHGSAMKLTYEPRLASGKVSEATIERTQLMLSREFIDKKDVLVVVWTGTLTDPVAAQEFEDVDWARASSPTTLGATPGFAIRLERSAGGPGLKSSTWGSLKSAYR